VEERPEDAGGPPLLLAALAALLLAHPFGRAK
jgi:hypothetical protein